MAKTCLTDRIYIYMVLILEELAACLKWSPYLIYLRFNFF
jgi:hypothetical protein